MPLRNPGGAPRGPWSVHDLVLDAQSLGEGPAAEVHQDVRSAGQHGADSAGVAFARLGDGRQLVGVGHPAATAVVVQVRERSILILVLSPQWQISLPPPPLWSSPMARGGSAV